MSAYVALGGNVEPARRLAEAAALLKQGFPGARFSRCYQNAALGFAGEDFINAAVALPTDLPIGDLLAELHRIEELCGRRRDDPKWAPRAMDLDLLLYGDRVGEFHGARLPRRDLLRRAYMLRPMAELAPKLRHPTAHRPLAELWAQMQARSPDMRLLPLDLNAV